MKKQRTITICSSASFYPEVLSFRQKLEKRGFKVLVPVSAEIMKERGDFDVKKYKTWFGRSKDLHKKTWFIQNHLKKILKGDVILVINLTKHGISGYVGGNTLIEMFYAFLKKKKIYMLRPISKKSSNWEEVMGLEPKIIHGDLSKIK